MKKTLRDALALAKDYSEMTNRRLYVMDKKGEQSTIAMDDRAMRSLIIDGWHVEAEYEDGTRIVTLDGKEVG